MQAIADYRADVSNPLYKEAEIRAMAAFLKVSAPGTVIEDLRHRRRHGDFAVISPNGTRFLVDVKTDKWIGRTGRLAWEQYIKNKDGSLSPGWGQATELGFLAFVQPGVEEPGFPWGMFVIPAARWRRFMETTLAEQGEEGAKKLHFGFYPFDIPNTNGKHGIGWAVPLHVLRREGLVWREMLI